MHASLTGRRVLTGALSAALLAPAGWTAYIAEDAAQGDRIRILAAGYSLGTRAEEVMVGPHSKIATAADTGDGDRCTSVRAGGHTTVQPRTGEAVQPVPKRPSSISNPASTSESITGPQIPPGPAGLP
jgi:hypothetical protein